MGRFARLLVLAAALCLGLSPLYQAGAGPDYAAQRQRLVHRIQEDAARTSRATGLESFDPQVLQVLAKVPRHEFVPPEYRSQAYANRPLPIGHGQTISQPYIVALMTDLLEPEPGHRVLEVGTGSGYQAAVLARLVDEVYSLEIIPELAASARSRLDRLGFDNVTVMHRDGYHGLPVKAPFQGIIVTAASSHIPPPLIEQLAPGGRMVIPVGGPFLTQELTLVTKSASGQLETRHLLPVRFVPLTGGH